MAERASHGTGISWTHVVARDGTAYKGETWNPTTGCTRVSSGCDNCYAFTLHDDRHARNRAEFREWRAATYQYPQDGPQSLMLARELGFKPTWPQQYDKPFSTVQLIPERLDVPVHAQKPRAYFVDSMADLFHEEVPDKYLDRVFGAMAMSPRHVFQVLTKRPERMAEYLAEGRSELVSKAAAEWAGPGTDARLLYGFDSLSWPLANVWLGVSAEDQPTADERIATLLDVPAAVHWVSAEPLLAPIELHDRWLAADWYRRTDNTTAAGLGFLDWIVVGGESGERRRSMYEAWARSILDQGRAAHVAVYMKQVSARRPGVPFAGDLDVREWPI